MKTILFCSIISITISSIPGFSQNQEENKKLSDIRFSYGITSLGERGNHFVKDESLIPYGAGFSLTFSLNEKLIYDFGISFMATDKIIYSGLAWDGVYSGPTYYELGDTYINIPAHINYKLLDTKPFKFLISSGPKFTINYNRYYQNPGWDGLEHDYSGFKIDSGLEFGLIEWIKITDKLGIFASQYFGYYFFVSFGDMEYNNFNIGLTYSYE